MRLSPFLLWLGAAAAGAQNPDPSTLDGKVLFGYQGWFRCPGGGATGTNWRHWANGTPSAASLTVDMYPDLREFDPGETCAVPGMTIGPRPALLFSSAHGQTVDRHFLWMRQYGLDGVLVQRFVTEIPSLRAAGDVVLRHVLAAARRHGRVFALEYDISGANAATLLATLQADWRYLEDTLGLTAHPGYLRHEGLPILGVWGIGLGDGRHPPNDPEAALRLLEWFRDTARVAYLGGTPAYWRTLSNDSATGPRWAAVYQAMAGIQPWTVGRYDSLAGADRWRNERLLPDLAATASRNQFYMPVVFPGFSWYNLNRGARQNQIPRQKGEFLWRQAYNARLAGAKMLKIAMFDEVDESTAMFKLAPRRSDAPDQGFWLTLDADGFTLPSDWYLRLAGEITRVFHDQLPPSPSLPATPGPPYAGAPALAAVNGASSTSGPAAPGAIVTLYGERLLPGLGAASTLIDSTGAARAPLVLYAAPGQWNIVVPEATAPGDATLVAERDDGSLAYERLPIQPVAPGIFPTAARVRVEQPDGTVSNVPVTVCEDSGVCQVAPIDLGPPGSVATLELYGTGFRGLSSLEAAQCTVAGQTAAVRLAGPVPDRPGLDQIHVTLPRGLAGTGPAAIRLSVDGIEANPALMSFR